MALLLAVVVLMCGTAVWWSTQPSSPPAFVLQGDFNFYTGNYSETWRGMIGRNGLRDLNLSGVQLLC